MTVSAEDGDETETDTLVRASKANALDEASVERKVKR